MSLDTTIKVIISATQGKALDLGNAQLPLSYSKTIALTNGNSANQANQMFADSRTLAASASENLDLAGALVDAFGATITFTKIKSILIFAASGNANDVVVGGHATAAFVNWVADATDKIKIPPGGLALLVAPGANGYAVTATSADMLQVANGGAGTSVTYDIVIIGVE